jgi:hypothetical protein
MANNTISGTETEDNDYSAFDEVSSSPDDQSDLTVANTEAESAPLEAVTDKSPPFTPRVTLLPQTQPASPGSEAEAIEENGVKLRCSRKKFISGSSARTGSRR